MAELTVLIVEVSAVEPGLLDRQHVPAMLRGHLETRKLGNHCETAGLVARMIAENSWSPAGWVGRISASMSPAAVSSDR